MNSWLARFRLKGDGGASLVLVLVALPAIILAASLAIDTANWFVHKRHLQTQADAGVLAAARDFQYPCSATTEAAIATTAHKYDGSLLASYNTQEPTPNAPTPGTIPNGVSHDIFSLLNSTNFAGQSSPADTGMTGKPCDDAAIDLKLSETNLPWFFKLAGVDYINAQARVSLQKLTSTGGLLPLGIPSPTPKNIAVQFIDESNGTVLKSSTLSTSDNVTWTSTADVTFASTTSDRVGLVVALGGNSSTTCGTPTVQCYDSGGVAQPTTPTSGVLFVRDWSADGDPGVVTAPATQPDPPQIRDVTLEPAGTTPCANGYFTASAAPCGIQLKASMKFGAGVTCTSVAPALPQAELDLVDSNNVSYPISCPSSGSATGVWTTSTTTPITVSPDSGALSFKLKWRIRTGLKPNASGGAVSGGTGSPSTCTAVAPCALTTAVTVQRTFAGASSLANAQTSSSGQIQNVSISETASPADNSVQKCGTSNPTNCTHTYTVTVKPYGFQNAGTIGSTPVLLRLLDSQGNGALDCGQGNGSSAFTTVMTSGCPNPIGTTQADPSVCATPATPTVCVTPNPGNGKKVEPGLDARIDPNNNNCNPGLPGFHPNYWVSPNTVSQIVSTADPRLVQVLVVPSGSFDGVTGSNTDIPVRFLASFYITDWNTSSCTGTGLDSSGRAYTRDHTSGNATPKGTVIGHFVKYVVGGSNGTGSGTCDPSGFGSCITILTK